MTGERRTRTRYVTAMICVAALLSLACREHPSAPGGSAPVAPVAPALPIGSRLSGEPEVPQFQRIEMDQVGSYLHIQFAIDPRQAEVLRYDPMRPGGWSFQLFLDTDQQPTGYWLGYDYLTRDAEADLDGRTIRVRRTIATGPPGKDGWGEETAVVPVHVNRSVLSFRLPLAALTDDDGRIDFALEMYRTAACDDCPEGRSFDYAYGLFGTSDPHGRSLVVRGLEDGHDGHFARLPVPAPPPRLP